MFIRRAVASVYLNPRLKMSVLRNCHNLCSVLRECLADKPSIDALEERTVCVRCVDEDENLYISTKLGGKPKHYIRRKHEPLKNTLGRIHISLVNPCNKKKLRKRTKGTQNDLLQHHREEHKYPADIKVTLETNQGGMNHLIIDENTANIDAWKNENILVIGNEEFLIRVNAPTVLTVTLPQNIMAGFPVVPHLEIEFAERESSKFMWFRRKSDENSHSSNTKSDSDLLMKPGKCCEQNAVWEFVSNQFVYAPSHSDIGFELKFVCVPKHEEIYGFSHEVVSCSLVKPGPGICPFDNRHQYTLEALGNKDQFRVISYNILADIYCSTDFAQTNLYPYCERYALDFAYRGQLILKEILGYNADVICLQECDMKVFNNFLQPSLKDEGFQGYYKRKAGEMPEGEALFYRFSKFHTLKESSSIISEAVDLECNKEILHALEECPELLGSLRKRTAIGQIVALRDNSDHSRVLCVLNTHLFFQPEATNIRLLQMSVLLNCLDDFVTNLTESTDDLNATEVGILICGDFNCTPDKAVVEFLLKGSIPSSHDVWNSGNSTEKFDQDLKHELKLFSACGFPKFTNYVVGFKATLDYIIPDVEHFNVDSCVPLPDEHLLSLHTALPSIHVPSDHLALVCNLSWKV